MNEQQSSFNGWARVEVMGHQTHIGFVKTESYGGAVLFRIDSPGAPEREYTLDSPEYAEVSEAGRQWCPKGTVVKRKERPPVSVLVGAASIYRIVPCTEEVALRAIEQEQRSELMLVSLPAKAELPAPATEVEDDSPFDDSDLCMDCGRSEEYCRCV